MKSIVFDSVSSYSSWTRWYMSHMFASFCPLVNMVTSWVEKGGTLSSPDINRFKDWLGLTPLHRSCSSIKWTGSRLFSVTSLSPSRDNWEWEKAFSWHYLAVAVLSSSHTRSAVEEWRKARAVLRWRVWAINLCHSHALIHTRRIDVLSLFLSL